MGDRSYSIVDYYAEQARYKCGYCKSPNTNFSHGMWAYSMTVQDYQNLIDRGWRRSGSYCYKPTMDQTCCPMYTIKCEALQFKITKSQKKILKRMAKFLRNELKQNDIMDTNDDQRDNIDMYAGELPICTKRLTNAEIVTTKVNVSLVDNSLNSRLKCDDTTSDKKVCDMKNQGCNYENTSPTRNYGHSSNSTAETAQSTEKTSVNAPCKKAKLLRIERKQNKLLAQGKSQSEVEAIFKENKPQNNVKDIEELFKEMDGGTKKLELKLVRTSPMSSGYLKTSKISYEIYKKYQTTIHGVPAEQVTEQRYTRFLVKSPLQIKLMKVMSEEFLKTLDLSANLYKKYQMAIHGDPSEECDKKSFCNFLVCSPLQQWTPDDGPPQGYGSFHEQYWLDNELIAVGVIDILPACVSSVYFFYDPAYSHLSLGTFSSLREVYLTRQLNKVANNLKYYYMGFYIHTCPKMRYKARMKPSKLLCPETYAWCNIEPSLIKLSREKYSRLNEDIDAIDIDGVVNINEVLVLYHEIAMPYKIYKARHPRNITKMREDSIKEYAGLVGMKCARSLLYRG
ncbi:hypothetical protein KM043_001702 [Ampulex compressa]|nr:hypothetical protein KM043_001702 [Ampulex compressa]